MNLEKFTFINVVCLKSNGEWSFSVSQNIFAIYNCLNERNEKMTYIIGEAITLPANGTRLFDSFEQALSQPTGIVQFAWDELNPYLFNIKYDEKVIIYDDNYDSSITNDLHQPSIPTKDYYHKVLRNIPS